MKHSIAQFSAQVGNILGRAARSGGLSAQAASDLADALADALAGNFEDAESYAHFAARTLPCEVCDGSGLIMHAKHTEFCPSC